MILQALEDYYWRKKELPAYGFEEKEIPYIVVLDKDGNVVDLQNTYESKRAQKFLVPMRVKRTRGIISNLLWDTPEYALGIKIKSDSDDENIDKMNKAFIAKIKSLGDLDDDGLKALKLFLDKLDKLDKEDKEDLLKKKNEQTFKELKEDKKAFITFRLLNEIDIISNSQIVKSAIEKSSSDSKDKEQAICLISGKLDNIAKTHSAIKGVSGTQISGSNIVSFNNDAYCSYGKKQGVNATCGERAVFAYTTALNHLLKKNSTQRIQVGDASTVFWAASGHAFENEFSSFFMSYEDNPDVGAKAVKALYQSIEKGAFNNDEGKQEFYVLGLSPNVSRISIRFFIKDTVKGMSENIAQYFKDLEIVCPTSESEFLPLFKLLVSTAVNGDSKNIAPRLAGDFMMSILQGLPYPQTLLQSVINRIKVERRDGKTKKKITNITYPRAAIIKAYLNRLSRYKKQKEEITVALDQENKNIGYVLGRLFATFEKLQQEAQGDTNSTIMRYYGSASSTPIAVFANLMRLHQHHLDKLSKDKVGRAIVFEKLIQKITDKININGDITYPTYLSLIDQGNFSIGYYHQRQVLFQKKDDKTNKN
jgi:CRISPR-associated protein Csd1